MELWKSTAAIGWKINPIDAVGGELEGQTAATAPQNLNASH
jgi:hypothetical protein